MTKQRSVTINPNLHRYLKVLGAITDRQINEILEPGGWAEVRQNRERLELALGAPLELPAEQTAQADA